MDSRIHCPRCAWFDIDYRADVNLSNSAPIDNASTLSGLSRACYENNRGDELPRLVWIMEEGNRDGRYEFVDIPSKRISASEKALAFKRYLTKKTDWTAGEQVELSIPNDLSLAFAKSASELDAILGHLTDCKLMKVERPNDHTRKVSLTITGADQDPESETVISPELPERLPAVDVEITGIEKDSGLYGKVYPGRQIKLDRDVAVKIIQRAAKPDAVDHAKGLAKVTHPNVVAVFDVGTVVDPVSGALVDCVVMEWLNYTADAFGKYEAKDVEGLLQNRLAKAKERLEETREAIKALCEPVKPPKDSLAYFHYFSSQDSGNASQLKENEGKRLALYKHVAALVRAYANLASEMSEAGYSANEAGTIKKEVKHYEHLRDEVKKHSGDAIDLKSYEPAMRHLIDSYIRAEESEVVSDFDDLSLVQLIVERGAEAVDALTGASNA